MNIKFRFVSHDDLVNEELQNKVNDVPHLGVEVM